MDLRQCRYVVTIAEQGSLARASEKLFITQSALNQQLLKLESVLEVRIFNRSHNHWTLTPAGEIYVRGARELLRVEKETDERIQDYARQWKRTVSVGITMERGIDMFASIYTQLHEQYPETVFQPVEATVDRQNQLLLADNLDVGFQTVQHREYPQFTYDTIYREPFYLCIPQSHPFAYHERCSADDYPYIALSKFRESLFTLVRSTSSMRRIVNQLFRDAGFEPKLLFQSVSMRTMQKLSAGGQCCCILPRYYAIPSEKVAYFRLEGDPGWELDAVYRKDHYLNQPTQALLKIAKEHSRSHLYSE